MTTGAGINGRCVGNTGAVTRKDFPGLCLEDSPLGVRFADFTSAFPAGINAAATWDKGLIKKRGAAMGAEHRGKGVNVALGPMMNLGRVAAGGRNWEGAGYLLLSVGCTLTGHTKPYLAGIASAETIKGVQSQGVIACAKHFIGNEQEHFRGGSGAQAESSNIDDRTIHELYLWPFAESVRAGVGSVMCSYNRVNQTFACENSKMINGLLKEELDFQGFVVSDWGGVESGVLSALAGADMDMPGFYAYGDVNQDNPAISNNSYWWASLERPFNNGSVPLGRVQDMVTRTMAAYYKMGQDHPDYPQVNFDQLTEDTYLNGINGTIVNEHIDVQADHRNLIREIGAASTVLLKNTKQTLPLSASAYRHWGIFGSDAGDSPEGPNGCVDRGCDSGTLAMGWGSGTANFPYIIAPLAAIQSHVHSENGNAIVEGVLNDYAIQVAAVARQADICLVFVNADSGEGYITVDGNAGDRNNLTLWHSGDDLIKNVTSECSNTVVVMHTVGPVIMEKWVENPNVTAILSAGLPGQETGNAIVDVLFGAVNPSGRLPYTIAKERADYPADVLYTNMSMEVPQITYSERLLIDYRWFDAQSITPRYEFGWGLSYTSFYYHDLCITHSSSSNSRRKVDLAPRTNSPGGFGSLWETAYTVSFTVENTGEYDGNEVSQLYLGFPKAADEPPKVLRGFERTYIKKGHSEKVSLKLTKKDISIWSVEQQAWVVPKGQFEVTVGQSSRTIRLTSSFSQ
ncbi:hypothetical protein RQP46_001311 [Phenoliferia psychrophenolica]